MIADPLAFIDAAAQRGVEIELTPDGWLEVLGPRVWLAALAPQIRARRAELIATLHHLNTQADRRIRARSARTTTAADAAGSI